MKPKDDFGCEEPGDFNGLDVVDGAGSDRRLHLVPRSITKPLDSKPPMKFQSSMEPLNSSAVRGAAVSVMIEGFSGDTGNDRAKGLPWARRTRETPAVLESMMVLGAIDGFVGVGGRSIIRVDRGALAKEGIPNHSFQLI
jgi:hypothetical protein